MTEHPDLADEQRFIASAYEGLEAMRAEANRMLQSVLDLGRGGTFQSRTERDIVVRTSLARLAQLDIGDQALCFGRIDRVPEPGQEVGDSFHIGRLAVSGPDHEPLVVDWRAPVAEPFYRATGLDPLGLARRRHLAVAGRTVIGLEDEIFSDEFLPPGERPAPAGVGGMAPPGLALGGPGALLAAIGQARTGRMSDIVATIQRAQDEIIRAPIGGVLLVQGGPGTGKTAVALHRAAYLLYTHRFPLERQGVLVVGPNPLFLRYIEHVLPSLGETGVTLTTVSGLVPDVRVRAGDPPEVAKLKGDARMAKVIARAVHTRQRPLRHDVTIPFGPFVLRLSAADTADVVRAAKHRPGPHNARRRFVEQQVVRLLGDQYRARLGADGAAGGGSPWGALGEQDDELDLSEEDHVELGRRLRRAPQVAEALDRMWPRLSPQELLHDLFGAPPLLASAGRGVLSDDEAALLHRPRSASLDAVAFTDADVALIDEARTVLGPRRGRAGRRLAQGERELDDSWSGAGPWLASPGHQPAPVHVAPADPDEIRAYGHIVVDEVQDLSPMQLRMLARRSISGSMTLVGDIAQATGPWAPGRWADVTRQLAPRRKPRMVELTVSYRTPAEVVALASRVLAVAAPEMRPPTPVRSSGFTPRIVHTEPRSLAAEVAVAAEAELAQVGLGRTAVLAPSLLLDDLARALAARGIDAVDPRDPNGEGLAAPLVLLPADQANGLEFDSVIVVEPARVVSAGDRGGDGPTPRTTRGLRALYVAMTRPTQRLTFVHSLPLPVELEPARSVAPNGAPVAPGPVLVTGPARGDGAASARPADRSVPSSQGRAAQGQLAPADRDPGAATGAD